MTHSGVMYLAYVHDSRRARAGDSAIYSVRMMALAIPLPGERVIAHPQLE